MALANKKQLNTKRRIICLFSVICIFFNCYSQIDSIAENIVDTIKSKLIVEKIPRKTAFDKFMYPHRWYVNRLLKPKVPSFDTTYIKSNKRKLTITIPVSKKFYGFNINDINTEKTLKFAPNNYYHVGFNFSNIILTFGFVPGTKFGAQKDKGTTKSKDIQLTIIGTRIITDINFQNYTGFYLYNTKEYQVALNPDTFIVRPDIHVFSFGINTMYVFNSRKYSLRGAFSFTDVQRKSAGSFMAGIYHSHVEFRATDSTFVESSYRPQFSPLLNEIKKFELINLGASIGYGYTYVYKKIIYSNCINIGFGGQKTSYFKTDDIKYHQPITASAHLNAKSSLRYDNLRFFSGILATYDNNYGFSAKEFKTQNYIAKVVFFVGYRFNIKQNGHKILKAMKLVDYEK
jgi:hypothetical protein